MTDTVATSTNVTEYKLGFLSGGILGAILEDGANIGDGLSALATSYANGDGSIPLTEESDTTLTTLEEILEQAVATADTSEIQDTEFYAAEQEIIQNWVDASAASRERAFQAENFFVQRVTDTTPEVLFAPLSTADIQGALNRASAEDGGGVVQLATVGTYALDEIFMPSNVRLEIAAGSILVPNENTLFNLAAQRNSAEFQNMEITTIGDAGSFEIDVTAFGTNGRIRSFRLGRVDNVRIANFFVLDALTMFSAMQFSAADDGNDPINNPTFGRTPKNVLVENASTTGAHHGYGLVQMQGGTNVLFRNIGGQGGVTLRLETGANASNQAGIDVGGLFDIYAEGVSCSRGQAAIKISPHGKNSGRVVARSVDAADCAFGVTVEQGFDNGGLANVVPGTFLIKPLLLDITVTRTAGQRLATLKFKDFNRVPTNLRMGLDFSDLMETGDGESRFFEPVVPIGGFSAFSLEEPGPTEDGRYGFIVNLDDVTSYTDDDPLYDEIYFDSE